MCGVGMRFRGEVLVFEGCASAPGPTQFFTAVFYDSDYVGTFIWFSAGYVQLGLGKAAHICVA